MKLRWAGDDKIMRGATALECLRDHCHGDHSAEARRGDIDGVMKRIGETFQIDMDYAALSTLEERCAAFVKTGIACGLIVDLNAPQEGS
jgi:hypothetical protein